VPEAADAWLSDLQGTGNSHLSELDDRLPADAGISREDAVYRYPIGSGPGLR
jgi:uncharacterized protein YjiS (DUF1127 family)